MARAARADRAGHTAERIAARRSRAAGRSDQGTRRTPTRGVRGRPPGAGKRVAKLAVLVASFCLVGFFLVLVVDVGARLVAKLDVGGSSFSQLVGKVVDRVLDRDVPRVGQPDRPRSPRRAAAPAAEQPRAPRPATRPEDDARHVEARPDPQVEQAKQRLDELLRRL